MFEAIGTLHSFAQQYQLKKSAKQKVRTGQSFDWKDAAKSSFVKAKEEPKETKSVFELYGGKTEKKDDVTKSARKSSIKQKLRRGKKLSPQDLEYLRQTDEALYEKAKTTMEEREKLERALKAAKTKAEAQRAVAIAYANAAALMSGNIGGGAGGAAAGVSSGGSDVVGTDEGTEGGASSFDVDTSMNVGTNAADANTVGIEAVSADAMGTEVSISADSVSVDGATNVTGAEAVGNENGTEASAEVEQENKDATSSLQQMRQDAEFDDPLILLVLRHLKAEWNDFMRSKTYRDLPEDEIQEAKRHGTEKIRQQRRTAEGVKAVNLATVASAYQTAKLDGESSRLLGSIGSSK